MKNCRLILGMGTLLVFSSAKGQNAEDVLRYSQTNVVGTARYASMGGAFGALGGDFSSLSVNPAGLSVYRGSEFMITPSVFSTKSLSSFDKSSREDFKFNFNLGNGGMVLTDLMQPYGDALGWVSRSFAFGYNRINNFHNNITIEGSNSSSSLLDVYLNDAKNNGNPRKPDDLDPFGSLLAYNAYLIDDTTGQLKYFSQIPKGTPLTQRKTITNEGSMGETYFALAGNYSNKLYLGASVGFSSILFEQSSVYEEITSTSDSSILLSNFKLNESLKSKGKGVNIKAGFIYRATDWVRFGLAFNSPTYYSMTDTWNSAITAHYKGGSKFNEKSPSGSFNYNIFTPAKFIGSLGLIVNKSGIISADYELVDYSTGRLRASSENYFEQNNAIQNNLKPAGNLRLGAEYKLDPFSFRAGFNAQGNPYKNSDLDGSKQTYTFGLGLRENNYFIDLSYAHTVFSTKHYFYDPELVSAAGIDFTSNNVVMTVGFKF